MSMNPATHTNILDDYSPLLGIRKGYPLLPHLFNIVLEVLAREVRQGKKKKRHRDCEVENVKLSLTASDIIWYIKNPKELLKTSRIIESSTIQFIANS